MNLNQKIRLSVCLILLLLGASTISLLTSTVSAQEDGNNQTASDAAWTATESTQLVSPDTIFTNVENDLRQQELETLYQALIEDYGVKLRQFSLNRAQWQSLQTLRSLEEAVVATSAVLLARDRTMITYYELLLEVLEKTPGIELTIKQKSKAELIARVEWLRQHASRTQESVDRDSVNLRSDEYTAQTEAMIFESTRALLLIRLGRLQTIFDRSNGLYERILARNKEKPGTSLEEVERSRAYTQVEVLRAGMQTDLRLARESLDETTAKRGKVQSNYAAFVTTLEKPYAELSKYLLYLEELARDTW